jgi:hypothetical protein
MALQANRSAASPVLEQTTMTHRAIKDVALEQLGEFLDAIGFKVRKKAPGESTLRVYVKNRQYPLLNPRFESSAECFGVAGHKELLVFTVFSKGLGHRFDHALGAFPSTDQCTFNPDARDRPRGYRLHGYFLLPLSFRGGPGEQQLDLAALKDGLIQMRDFLQQKTC